MTKPKPLNRKYKVLMVRHSCLTGKVVLVYRGPNRHAADQAYYRAKRKEMARTRRWGDMGAQRKQNILRILNEALADIPITQALTPEQVAAAKRLRALSTEDIANDREFYEHIIEEARRRKEAKEIRSKSKTANEDYV